MDWKISEKTVLQPDLFVACFDFKNAKYITQAPCLAAEILSPSNRNKDFLLKKEIYRQQGVKYYVVIDPDDNSYVIYEISGGDYKVAQAGHSGSFQFIFDECFVNIDFGKIFNS